METSIRRRFGEKVKALRHASGTSQEAFADKCGFARSYMSRIERGKANPSLDAVEILAVALGVEVKVLFEVANTGLSPAKAKPSTIQVPFAADGSCFKPSLRRPGAGKFSVGEKGRLVQFVSFDDALAHLKGMATAKWLRPNKSGAWGLVSAVRWDALPKKYSTS